MLNYNEIKAKTVIVYEDEPWVVIESQVSRKQANKPVNKTKIKNLIMGNVINHTFHVSDTVEEADVSKRDIKYLYQKRDEFWFCNPDDPSDRFQLDESLVGDTTKFMKQNSIVEGLVYDNGEEEKIVGITLPIKVELTVTEAPPNIKGNTASGSGKKVTVETGAQVQTPFFIEKGDTIIVNTENGNYIERAK
jgi:elongation factor P